MTSLFRKRMFACLAAILFASGTPAPAAACEVGSRVQGEMGGGKVGRIAEIGKDLPYEGKYRIVFDWNEPKGDWYDPNLWQIRRAGTNTVCGQAADAQNQHPPLNPPGAPLPNTGGQQATCNVGTRVQGDMGGGKVGTIAEIGKDRPYEGKYRIVFDWNQPSGDWYDPTLWRMFVAGTQNACGAAAAPAPTPPPPPQNLPNAPDLPPPLPPPPPQAGPPANNDCPMNETPGLVTKGARASAALFQRIIYEKAAGRINPASVSAPKKVGVTFLAFDMGDAFENTLSSSRFGDKRRYDAAPVGATIYPFKARELTCELFDTSIMRWVTENEGVCFKDDFNEWTCSHHTNRTVEKKDIPLR
jgi:hypothetical protein